MQRFAPLNSWPDNANLDKARRLLWPVKQKYGNKISWADLLVFAGNVALESAGFETFGFAFGRPDFWEPEEILFGEEDEWSGTDKRYSGARAELEEPYGATTMGLIYVNPEGPEGKPDPLAAAIDIRETFGRMAMNDEETAALIVGGHTLGKTHGAGDADLVGPEPEAAPIEQQGLGWKCAFAFRQGRRLHHQRPRGGVDAHADAVEQRLPGDPVRLRVGADQESRPARGSSRPRTPRRPFPIRSAGPSRASPRCWSPTSRCGWTRSTARSRGAGSTTPRSCNEAFAKAWYKLLHRDMGPISRYLGPWVAEPQLWQDPVPAVEGELIDEADIAALKSKVLDSGLSVPQLVKTAWSSAASFRSTDKRGGANGARLRLEPQKNWEANEPCRAGQGAAGAGEDPAGLQRLRSAARRCRWPT